MDSFLNVIQALTITREAVVLIGVIGNILSFIVFSRRKFQNNSINVYCRALAIVDLFCIIQFIYDITTNYFNYDLYIATNSACKFFFFVIFCISPTSGWILVAFSIDKMAIVHQMRGFSSFLAKKKIQLSIVAFIFFFHCLLFMAVPIFIQLSYEPSGNGTFRPVCDLNYLQHKQILLNLYVVESSFIPFAIMTVTTVVTLRSMRNARKNLNQNRSFENSRKQLEFKYAISSIAFNMLFICLKTPLSFYYIVTIEDFFVNIIFLFSSLVAFFLNYSSRFFMHLCFNSAFRKEFALMIGLKSQSVGSVVNTQRDTATNTNNTLHGLNALRKHNTTSKV
jgi:hypothetical protein